MSDAKPLTNQSNQEAQRDLIEQAQTVNCGFRTKVITRFGGK